MPRSRKSLELHALQGTTPDWTNPGATSFAGGKPKMPRDLSEVERAEWRRLTKELGKRGTLTRVDSSALEIYVRMFGRWKACVADIEKRGPVVESTWVGQDGIERSKFVENPSSKIANRLENSMRAMLKEFGSTPASREAAKPTAPPKPAAPQPGSDEWYAREIAAGRDPFSTPEIPDAAPVVEPARTNDISDEELEKIMGEI